MTHIPSWAIPPGEPRMTASGANEHKQYRTMAHRTRRERRAPGAQTAPRPRTEDHRRSARGSRVDGERHERERQRGSQARQPSESGNQARTDRRSSGWVVVLAFLAILGPSGRLLEEAWSWAADMSTTPTVGQAREDDRATRPSAGTGRPAVDTRRPEQPSGTDGSGSASHISRQEWRVWLDSVVSHQEERRTIERRCGHTQILAAAAYARCIEEWRRHRADFRGMGEQERRAVERRCGHMETPGRTSTPASPTCAASPTSSGPCSPWPPTTPGPAPCGATTASRRTRRHAPT